LVHYEEDFMQYRGFGPLLLARLLAWREEMRARHAKPAEVLTAEVLKSRYYDAPLGLALAPRVAQHLPIPSIERASFTVRFNIEIHGDDPLLIEKVEAVKRLLSAWEYRVMRATP